jgi:glutamate carboxypeptidase
MSAAPDPLHSQWVPRPGAGDDWLTHAQARVPAYLALLQDLVTRESPSRDETRCRQLADYLAHELRRVGAKVERHPAPGFGEHLEAHVLGAEQSERPLLVVGHLDTVHAVGTLERNPCRVDSDRIWGPGSYDMKAGIAAAIEALGLLATGGRRPQSDVTLLITCDEEIGSTTSRALIEEKARQARAALVLEPSAPGGKVKASRKGVAVYDLHVRGRPAHAGIEPDAGASAIHELARLTLRLLTLSDKETGTTVNVGVVQGGTRSNVVAEEARAQVDVRFWTSEEAARVDAAVRGLRLEDPRCVLEVGGGIDRPPLERTPESDRLFERAREAGAAAGLTLERTGTGGASDGNLTSGVGCPTLDGLGPDGGGAHTLDEHVLLSDVPRRVALLAALFARL